MKAYLLRALLFLTPLLAIPLADALVFPVDCWTFRSWEGLRKAKISMPGPFYPRSRIDRIEVGDLGNGTALEVPRHVEFVTDRHGFRRRDLPDDTRLVTVIGTSFTVSPGITQDETFPSVIERELGRPVYPYASARVAQFLQDERFNHRTDAVVVECVEWRLWGRSPRRITRPRYRVNITAMLPEPLQDVLVRADRVAKLAILFGARGRLRRAVHRWVTDRRPPPVHIVGTDGKTLFMHGARAITGPTKADVDVSIEWLVACRDALAEQGIPMLALPLPNKETVLYERLPGKPKPWALDRIVAGLRAKGVPVVDVQPAFAAAQHQGIETYQLDDTHWSQDGARIAGELVAKRLRELLKDAPQPPR